MQTEVTRCLVGNGKIEAAPLSLSTIMAMMMQRCGLAGNYTAPVVLLLLQLGGARRHCREEPGALEQESVLQGDLLELVEAAGLREVPGAHVALEEHHVVLVGHALPHLGAELCRLPVPYRSSDRSNNSKTFLINGLLPAPHIMSAAMMRTR